MKKILFLSLLLFLFAQIVNSQTDSISTISISGNDFEDNSDQVTPSIPDLDTSSRKNYQDYILEFIKDYHSDITISTEGGITVVENITIVANGNQFKRGFIRSIPLYQKDKSNRSYKVNIQVNNVFKDGEPVLYEVSVFGNNKEIRIGDPHVFLNPGIYSYQISYSIDDQIDFYDDFDELYWNVTGNDWAFYIQNPSATIHLPQGAKSIQNACYTGEMGETNSNCRYIIDELGNTISFFSSSLNPNEGFTIATGFTPHIIERPSGFITFFKLYGRLIIISLIFLINLIFYFTTWYRYGRNAREEIVIPTFEIPENYSAAAIRYIHKRSFDLKTFVCIIVQLAVKKCLAISTKGKNNVLVSQGIHSNLSEEEQKVYERLFKNDKQLSIVKSNASIINVAQSYCEIALKKINIEQYFKKNSELKQTSFFMFLISLLLMFAVFLFILKPMMFTIGGLTVVALLFWFFKKFRSCFVTFFAIISIFFIISFSVFTIVGAQFVGKEIFLGIVVILVISYIVYYKNMTKKTQKGQKISAQIKGLKMYLETAEENRLNMLYVPERTPQLYEKMLPYAMALDVENKWGEKFVDVFERVNYEPDWIDKRENFNKSFGQNIASSLKSSISSATYVPSSSSGRSSGGSGSSGGGSSGGGRGGGGGRGW